ncbi:MAG: GNAT family N-acetyltransferase [Oscillospiraceae bacterium]|nr:GNAT family N-acetyltransferase [Oscillospiraceae bacterium]
MDPIRKATPADAGRIAELIVTNYRVNFYPFLKTDEFFFDELNVLDTAAEYAAGSEALAETIVYDDGIVKGMARVQGDLLDKLYVEPAFQNGGIGAALLTYAVEELGANRLWALQYNTRGIAFYERHGFALTGEKMFEDDWVPLLKMSR